MKQSDLPTAWMGFRHTCEEENAAKFAAWIKSRGGVAVWQSSDPARPDLSWSTPATSRMGDCQGQTDGEIIAFRKPTEHSRNAPTTIITDPAEIGVHLSAVVKRFHIGIHRSTNGLEVTAGGTRRIHAEVAKAGDGAFHTFDLERQDALIHKPSGWTSLAQWIAARATTEGSQH